MKKFNIIILLFTLAVAFTLNSCSSNSSSNEGESEEEDMSERIIEADGSDHIENFNCGNFFSKGDYSKVCLFNEALPFNQLAKGSSEDTHCEFILGESQATFMSGTSRIGVGFLTFGDIPGMMQFINSEKERLPEEVTDITVSGAKGYMRENKRDSDHFKFLKFPYKNVMVMVSVHHYYPAKNEVPCIYSTEEMMKFAEEIYNNMPQ